MTDNTNPQKYRVVGLVTKKQLVFIRQFMKENGFAESHTVRHFIQFYIKTHDLDDLEEKKK